MPLMLEAPPAGIEKVVDATLAELVGHGALALGRSAKPAVAHPLPVFHLGADAVAAGQGLAAVQRQGWLATVSHGDQVVGGLELASVKRPKQGAPSVAFSSFNTGPFQRGLAEAIAQAGTAAGRKSVSVSVLRIPALHLVALWLKDGETDMLVPIPPAPPPLQPRVPVPAAEALDALREAAKVVLAGDDAQGS
jgi:hypothetical protein